MTNTVGQYQITSPENTDVSLLEDSINELKRLGKKKVYPYGAGQICFHHRQCYFFLSPTSMKWAPRHKAHAAWYTGARSVEEMFNNINGWCDYRDRKRKEKQEV
jgi:hypothetical protein